MIYVLIVWAIIEYPDALQRHVAGYAEENTILASVPKTLMVQLAEPPTSVKLLKVKLALLHLLVLWQLTILPLTPPILLRLHQ